MSCVAEANAVNTNNIYVNVNMDIGVEMPPIISADGRGMLNASRMNAMDIRICMVNIHHLFVRKISTIGLHSGLSVQGRYRRLVNKAISPLGTPIFVNIVTEILFTMKYGIPSAK